jgi:uncharacterized protein with HEPN domain
VKEDLLYLIHILDAFGKIQTYTTQGREVFFANPVIQDAVVRNYEIVGEAAKRVSSALREAHPEIPWTGLAGLRDVLIHRYAEVNVDRVWAVTAKELPALKSAIEAVAATLGSAS